LLLWRLCRWLLNQVHKMIFTIIFSSWLISKFQQFSLYLGIWQEIWHMLGIQVRLIPLVQSIVISSWTISVNYIKRELLHENSEVIITEIARIKINVCKNVLSELKIMKTWLFLKLKLHWKLLQLLYLFIDIRLT